MSSKYIRVVDALPPQLCRDIIRAFESRPDKHIDRSKIHAAADFVEMELGLIPAFSELNKMLVAIQSKVVSDYIRDVGATDVQLGMRQRNLVFEGFRIKRYLPGQQFKLHTDDAPTRKVAFLYYLNDDFKGGHTRFPHHEVSVQPKTGSVCIFPATWEYLHAGEPPTEGTKYIFSSYLIERPQYATPN